MANNTNWLSISSQSGSSGQTILTLSTNKNLSTNYKTAEITAYNPVYNVSAKTYVTIEAYSPYIEISPTLIPVADSGGTFELSISANCSWVIAYPDLVSSYSTTAGTGNRTITFSVPSTTADTTLVGNIVVTDESGQVSRTARIEQYGSGAHISLFPVELYFDSTGGSKTFSVSADCAYNVSMASGADWARVTPNSGYTGQTTFTVTVDSGYTGDTQRSTAVLIDAPGTGGVVAVYQRKPETRLIVGYYVTSTTEPTAILGTNGVADIAKAEYPDGTEITPATAYTFPATGMQYVYYTLSGATVPYAMLDGFDYPALSSTVKTVIIPNGVTGVSDYSFWQLSGLTSVTLPDTLQVLGLNSFNGCTSLSSITLPNSLTSIGLGCFRGCTSLSSITIPSGVTAIGSGCFTGSSVSSITFNSLTPPTLGNANALTSSTLSEIIVPCPAVNDYITAWPQYAQYISCQDTGTTLYFVTDTSNVKGVGETRTITILNTNINPNRTGLNLPSDFPQQGSYTVVGNTIYLTYPRNPSSSATRSWTIGVVAQTNDGVSLSGSYSITQNANVTYSIPYTADTSNIDASGETRTITIDASNLVASSITIGVEGATGVSYTYNNGIITIVFPRNNTAGERNITVTVSGVTTTGNSAIATIPYIQNSGVVYQIPYTADTSTVSETGETRYIYIDCSQLIGSSITVSSSGISGIVASYDSATCIVTVVFPNASGGNSDILEATILVEGETINGNYAYAVVYYEQAGVDISTLPLTFAIKTDGYIRWGQMNTVTTDSKAISYSKNGGEWVQIRSSVVPLDCPKINVVAGDVLRFKGENTTYGSGSYGDAYFKESTAEYSVYGNIMSMVYGDNFSGQTAFTGSFKSLFAGEQVHSAKSLLLPTTYLNSGAYGGMFQNCGKLTETPSLPATTVSGGDYAYMFAYCTSLKQVPPLPSVMDIGIYNSNQFAHMFEGCTGLTTIPSNYLPTLAQGVETGTRLPPNCFEGMFKGCTNLVQAPNLPYTVLGDYCYKAMFQDCTSLVTAPALPATTFILYGSTMAEGCYQSMFANCTSLVNPPALPITELKAAYGNADHCYEFMFSGCTSLTQAPELKALVLTDSCYRYMFYGCTSLNYIKCLALDISAADCTAAWVTGVASSGTFVKEEGMQNWTTGSSGIPSGWIVENYETEGDYLTFEITSNGKVVWKTSDSAYTNTIQYKKNNGTWTSIKATTGGTNITVVSGDTVQFRGYNTRYCDNEINRFNSFSGTTAGFKVKGNIMSLIDMYGFSTATTINSYAFVSLFRSCTTLTDASLLTLPVTIANNCYYHMFSGCTSLIAAPALPATTLANSCYGSMFYGCTSLTTAPVLPAATLAPYCYYDMFYGCTSLNYIKCLALDISAERCIYYWVRLTAESGTFVKHSAMNDWHRSNYSGIPENWTIQDAT